MMCEVSEIRIDGALMIDCPPDQWDLLDLLLAEG